MADSATTNKIHKGKYIKSPKLMAPGPLGEKMFPETAPGCKNCRLNVIPDYNWVILLTVAYLYLTITSWLNRKFKIVSQDVSVKAGNISLKKKLHKLKIKI